MQRRYCFGHFILAVVIVLVLTLSMVDVDAQAQIAFSSNRDGNTEIYVMAADGKNQRRLTNNPASDYSPSWSPDGKRIAFVSRRDGHVHPMGWPTSEIYVMAANGGNQRRLTNNPFADWSPSWSPDGKRIAFSSDRDRDGDFNIYVMDADGKNQQRLTNNRHRDSAPAWFNSAFAVAPAGKTLTRWGWLKQIHR